MVERSAAQIAAARRWRVTHPNEFTDWVKKQPRRVRPARPLFETQRVSSGMPGPKVVILAKDWDAAVEWLNDPDNMRSPESGKLTRFSYQRNFVQPSFRFSQWTVRFAFKMRFAAPKA